MKVTFHKIILLNDRKLALTRKAFIINSSACIKLPKSQISKTIQTFGFSGNFFEH